jgi:excisionase family DNA binding protein
MTITEASRPRGRAHRYREVAEILNCSERSVIRLVRQGLLRADRIGPRVVRIFDDSIDQYAASVREQGAVKH